MELKVSNCVIFRDRRFSYPIYTTLIRSLSILPCRMLLSLGILIYFMADPLVSIGTTINTPRTTRRFDRIEEGEIGSMEMSGGLEFPMFTNLLIV